MATAKPICYKSDCFRNKCGIYCGLLDDIPSVHPCPFYKTDAEADSGILEAHNKLLAMGEKGMELIKKYEYNSARKGQW